ncbi:putative HTH-type transcriptional regulator/GBAA_1941/BAS1801 [Pseudoruegeria aquimaris]|uniref:Putative HTH-type transcriptional regulator/GBAA_1941/BAS1801 n=2 Tax=Pseudoruegeria aquimaris TaxID=393663 RepID=A0A1Y5SJ58_9RHOB|nr:putative HTH-type transcriptional regulator/GBAA_1941/BAS1801 [Pseudoruegeria aquimaris]
MVSSGGMTSRLDRLETRGLIERAPNPEDRRGTIVSLTQEGKALAEAVLPELLACQARALSTLNERQQKRLATLLPGVMRSAADGLPEDPDDAAGD